MMRQPDGRLLAPWERDAHSVGGAAPVRWPGNEAPPPPAAGAEGMHPLSEPALGAALSQRAAEITAAFAGIGPLLRRLAPQQFDDGFSVHAHQALADTLEVDIPAGRLESRWNAPVALGRIYACCVLGVFCNLVERDFDRNVKLLVDEGESAEVLIRRFGFHAIDITPCSDGRLAGTVDFVLRVPQAVVVRRESHAGAKFDVQHSLGHWESVELRRWREGWPNSAEEATRYLKLGVYHFSSLDPRGQGCAAYGSDDALAAGELLTRLQHFEQAVEAVHGSGDAVATLLVGVDTDTDAIRVHVPDAAGTMNVERFVSSGDCYDRTRTMSRQAAKDAIRDAVARCAGVASDDTPTEGIRWLCGYLVKNNLGQVDAVRRCTDGSYADRGHAELLIAVGDGIDDVQLRNLAFQAQMSTLEESAGDLDIGMDVFSHRQESHALPVPVLVHFAYDARIPGARETARQRALRLSSAIEARYAGQVASGVVIQPVIRALGRPQQLERLQLRPTPEPPGYGTASKEESTIKTGCGA